MNKLTEEQRLEKAIMKLLSEKQLAALFGVMMIGTKTISDKHPTAATDGKNEWYGRQYVASMGDKKLRGLILHELGHKMYQHLTTWQHLWKIDPQRANLAADYVVDQWVQDEIDKGVDAEVPDPTIDPRFKGFSVQQVWDALPPSKGGKQGKQGKDQHDWEGAQQMTPEQRQQLAHEIDSALRQGYANVKPEDRDRAINELLEPAVDWRECTREFVQTYCAGSDFGSWRRPNRRFLGAGFYMPSGVSERIGELVVAIDTSGSIDQAALTEFLSELVGIVRDAKPERIRLLYWGSVVVADEVYESDQMGNIVNATKPADGGGTDPQCIPEYMAKHNINPQAVVVLTDGYVPNWGQWAHPVLWCIKGNRGAQPDTGKTVHVE
jgi:predicted metal-dependent peptidase